MKLYMIQDERTGLFLCDLENGDPAWSAQENGKIFREPFKAHDEMLDKVGTGQQYKVVKLPVAPAGVAVVRHLEADALYVDGSLVKIAGHISACDILEVLNIEHRFENADSKWIAERIRGEQIYPEDLKDVVTE